MIGTHAIRRGLCCGLLVALAACGAAAPTAQPTAVPPTVTPAATPQNPGGDAGQNGATGFRPLPEATCANLRELMAKTLDVDVALQTASFRDFMSGEPGEGCELSAKGTGKDFAGGVSAVAGDLKTLLAEEGWAEDPTYVADGPMGSALGMRKGQGLALVLVDWLPAPEVSCPADQPIGACEMTPEQQIYSIRVQLAEK